MNFRKIFFSASVAALVAVFGCSSSSTGSGATGDCGSVGSKTCPNDPAQTQASVDLCNKCKVKGQAYATCEGTSTAPSCGADGKSVASKTDMTKCTTEYDALLACFTM